MGTWIKRGLIAYLVVWAGYFCLALYLERSRAGTPDRSSSAAWRTAQQTALWPYVFWRLYYAPDYASAIRGDTFSDKKK